MERQLNRNNLGKYNTNFIDWNNEWERVSEIEIKIENGVPIEDFEEEQRVRMHMISSIEKLGIHIDKFPIVKNVNTNKECYICLKNFIKNRIVRKLPCNHMFCEECVLPWFKNSSYCPTCKFNLKEDE